MAGGAATGVPRWCPAGQRPRDRPRPGPRRGRRGPWAQPRGGHRRAACAADGGVRLVVLGRLMRWVGRRLRRRSAWEVLGERVDRPLDQVDQRPEVTGRQPVVLHASGVVDVDVRAATAGRPPRSRTGSGSGWHGRDARRCGPTPQPRAPDAPARTPPGPPHARRSPPPSAPESGLLREVQIIDHRRAPPTGPGAPSPVPCGAGHHGTLGSRGPTATIGTTRWGRPCDVGRWARVDGT